MNQEQYVDHEARIRVQEKLSERIFTKLDTLDQKLDTQFKWIIGTMIVLFVGMIPIIPLISK